MENFQEVGRERKGKSGAGVLVLGLIAEFGLVGRGLVPLGGIRIDGGPNVAVHQIRQGDGFGEIQGERQRSGRLGGEQERY